MTDTSSPALPHLESDRLILRLATEADVPAIVSYYRTNRRHLQPFDPLRSPSFYKETFWSRQVRQSIADFQADRALRLFLFPRKTPDTIVGTANFSHITRGVAQSCVLGYGLSADVQGRGLMYEALQNAIPFIFSSLGLHRIEANYMPHNRRSGNLLKRLGFVAEGYSRDFLIINGRWEDHVRTSLINPHWRPRESAMAPASEGAPRS